MYKVYYHKRAQKQIKKLPKPDQRKVNNKLKVLRINPFSSSLDIKPFYNTEKGWRLRIGNLRVIYLVNKDSKVIYVEHIGYRGDIYKS